MFGLSGRSEVRDLTAQDVATGLAAGTVVLVDVREPNETAIERFPGAVLMPLSGFDPEGLPDPGERTLVFACAAGARSRRAADVASSAGRSNCANLAGGIKAWKAAGLPVET